MTINQVTWGARDQLQIDKYREICNLKLRDIDFPSEFTECCDKMCLNMEHKNIIDKLYNSIVSILSEAAICTYNDKVKKVCKDKYIIG